MKILFVENRGKTIVYNQVARELEKKGHKIFWIIINHAIKVNCGTMHKIPYPEKSDMVFDEAELNKEAYKNTQKSDRYVIYRNGGTNHYPYYFRRLENIINDIMPDVVFGEMSTFCCVMCEWVCQKNKIPMYAESSARYPRGRFTFNIPDKYRQISSSGETIDFEAAKLKWQEIATRKSKPDYMDELDFGLKQKILIKIRKEIQRINYYIENVKGEKYVTWNLADTIRDNINRARYKKAWNKIAQTKIKKSGRFVVLFPLQYQPEFNLDVWGNKYRNQTATIRAIADVMPEDVVLYVKPNPKFNLEIDSDLINCVKNTENVYALTSDTKMDSIFNDIDMVITVTGTISIECVFAGKPVISLSETVASGFAGCVLPPSIAEVGKLMVMAMQGEFPLADDAEKYKFYSHLIDSSYAGIMDDFTRTTTGKMGQDNLEKIVTGYSRFLDQLDAGLLDFNAKENFGDGQSQHG